MCLGIEAAFLILYVKQIFFWKNKKAYLWVFVRNENRECQTRRIRRVCFKVVEFDHFKADINFKNSVEFLGIWDYFMVFILLYFWALVLLFHPLAML